MLDTVDATVSVFVVAVRSFISICIVSDASLSLTLDVAGCGRGDFER